MVTLPTKLPAFVSGVRQKFGGETVIRICDRNGDAFAFVLCGREHHLQALAEAKAMVAGLNACKVEG